MSGNWLPITDYSAKHKISVSTLRRRIKADDIQYRFIEGKYWLLDEPITTQSLHRPSLSETKVKESSGPAQNLGRSPTTLESETKAASANNSEAGLDGPILSAANRLLTELKKAYTQILQEKEEQILHLKEEVTDLKTLVRVLEGENEKLSTEKNKNRADSMNLPDSFI